MVITVKIMLIFFNSYALACTTPTPKKKKKQNKIPTAATTTAIVVKVWRNFSIVVGFYPNLLLVHFVFLEQHITSYYYAKAVRMGVCRCMFKCIIVWVSYCFLYLRKPFVSTCIKVSCFSRDFY